MKENQEAKLLRIFIGESDRWRHGPLYEAIVMIETVEVIRYRAKSNEAWD